MIPFLDYGGSGPLVHFAHANGYPPECYSPLLTRLAANNKIISMYQRPLWKNSNPDEITTWHPLTKDFLQFLTERSIKKVVAIGHSLGGIVSLRAALLKPFLFSALILLDPVLLPPDAIALLFFLRIIKQSHLVHPLAKETINRRRQFNDLNDLYTNYRQKPIFKNISDTNLRAYIEGLTVPNSEHKLTLRYSPEWESKIYITGMWKDMDIWRGLPKINLPILIIRGENTDTFWIRTARLMQKKQQSIKVVTIEGTSHLVPLESPELVAGQIQDFLSSLT